MNVCVFGLWHLGTVTSACLAAAGHRTIGLDLDPGIVARLAAGSPPIFEPGLEDLVKQGRASGHLNFTSDLARAAEADVLWVTLDTPVDENDRGDVESVVEQVSRLKQYVADGALVLISSQLPAGTTRRLEAIFKGRSVTFGYSPENLRLGGALDAFMRAERIVVGLRSPSDRDRVQKLLGTFTDRIEWTSVESAEMTKHALNAFLATSVAFVNEIAVLCEQVGADANEVERGLKSDRRIGPRAYLSPGSAIAGGTLARDIVFLSALGASSHVATPLLSAVRASHEGHRAWVRNRLTQVLGGVAGKTVAVWGLTYKPGTDTLRRSDAIELCRWAHAQGAIVQAHDPVVKELPSDIAPAVRLFDSAADAARGAHALVVSTPWPEYRQVMVGEVVPGMKRPVIIDANRFLGETLGGAPGVEYFSVGRASR